MVRVDPMTYVRDLACEVLGNQNCYPVVQPNPDQQPSIVYYSIGSVNVVTSDAGPHDVSTAIRVESRAKTYGRSVEIDKDVISKLRAGGRLISVLSLIDEYDNDLSFYRRIRSVMVRR